LFGGFESENDMTDDPRVTIETEDMGIRIGRVADALTPEQLNELLAIQWFALPFNGKRIRSALSSLWKTDEPYASLIANGIIQWQFKNKSQGYAIITEFGLHVIHCRVRRDLRTAGAIPPEPENEEYDDG
jgi:hypothetical protein